MGLIGTLKETLAASAQTSPGGESASEGAYWCDDCDVRMLDTEVDEEDPTCPECGGSMTFERSPGSTGCAC
jgi:Zn finger protein HypA/HybF involved in hydrogenase expression